MNKQLAKKGTTLNKNMTNMESLSLTDMQCTSASITTCTSNYIKTNELSCNTLDIPISIPTKTIYAGTMYFDTTTHDLYIHDGNDWNYVQLNVV